MERLFTLFWERRDRLHAEDALELLGGWLLVVILPLSYLGK